MIIQKKWGYLVIALVLLFGLLSLNGKIIQAQSNRATALNAGLLSYSYSYVDQNPAGAFRLDEATTFEVRLRNTGTDTWYRDRATGCSVHLGTGEPGGSGDHRAQDHTSPFHEDGAAGWLEGLDTNGVPYDGRRVLMVENSVAPNDIATFRFAVKVPNTIGDVYEYWTPVVEGAGCGDAGWLPSIGLHFQATVFPFRYSFVSRDPAYDYWHSQPQNFEIVVRNEGPATWYKTVHTNSYAVHLATGVYGVHSDANPYRVQDHASPFYTAGGIGWWTGTSDKNRIVMQENSVAPGQNAHFRFAASVHTEATAFWEYFTPIVEDLDWMEHQSSTTLRINNNPYRAEVRSQDPPYSFTMQPGLTKSIQIKFENSGVNSWQQDSTRLGTVDPDTNAEDYVSPFAHSSWINDHRPAALSESAVAPGAEGTFSFTVQAPLSGNTYKLRVRPLAEYDWWMEEQDMDVSWIVYIQTPTPTDTDTPTPTDTDTPTPTDTDTPTPTDTDTPTPTDTGTPTPTDTDTPTPTDTGTPTPTDTDTPTPTDTDTPTPTITPSPTPAGDAYEDDDACARASTLIIAAPPQQHTFHDFNDNDWVKFTAALSQTYIIEVNNVGPQANIVLKLFDECAAPPAEVDDNAFGRGARITWNCPETGEYYLRVTNRDPEAYGAEAYYDLSVRMDTAPPAAPQDFRATPGDGLITLAWRANTERDAVGYRLYYGTMAGVYDNSISISGRTTTHYELDGLQNGQPYYLTFVAVDFAGYESARSTEITATPFPEADQTIPTIDILFPTTNGVYTTVMSTLLVTGTCTDAGANLSHAHLGNGANGEQGWDYTPEGGAANFNIGGIPLELGDNQLTVTVYDDVGNHAADTLTVRRVAGQGVAIIVAGHDDGYRLQENIYYCANRAYRIFRKAGFAANNIYYLSPTAQDAHGKDGVSEVNADSTPDNLQAAITTWARERLGPEAPFYLYLMDHGEVDALCANDCAEGGYVWADKLDEWLTDLETATGVDEVNVIVEACHSGSFINGVKEISAPGRVVIASATDEELAWASTYGAHFSDAFFSKLERGSNLGDSFTIAVTATNGIQHPWLDDNGNASPNDAEDKLVAQGRRLLTSFGGGRPEVTAVQWPTTLAGTLPLTATVEENGEAIAQVWAAVYPPSWTLPDAPEHQMRADGAVYVELQPAGDGIYTGEYSPLNEMGEYRIVLWAMEADGTLAAPLKRTLEIGITLPEYDIYLPLVLKNA